MTANPMQSPPRLNQQTRRPCLRYTRASPAASNEPQAAVAVAPLTVAYTASTETPPYHGTNYTRTILVPQTENAKSPRSPQHVGHRIACHNRDTPKSAGNTAQVRRQVLVVWFVFIQAYTCRRLVRRVGEAHQQRSKRD